MTALLDELSPDQRLALSYGSPASREGLVTILVFDRMLGRALTSTSEPLMSQVRLAWWRDQAKILASSADVRDPTLRSLQNLVLEGRVSEAQLEALVDAWEILLDDDTAPHTLLAQFGSGRGSALFGMAASVTGCLFADVMTSAARTWALVDFARSAGDKVMAERAFALAAETTGFAAHLPGAMRPLAILARFAERDIARGFDVRIAEGSPRRILEAWGLLIGRS